MAPFNSSERRRSCRALTILIAISLAGMAVVVHAPAASASTTFTAPTPDVGILPFKGDVFTIGSNGSLIAVDPTQTSLSAPLFNLAGSPLNLTWGQFSSATAKSYAWTDTHRGTTHTQFLIGMTDRCHLPLRRQHLRACRQLRRVAGPSRQQRRTLPVQLRHRRNAPIPDHPKVKLKLGSERAKAPSRSDPILTRPIPVAGRDQALGRR